MENKRTLFNYLYHLLREQIETGYLRYGEPFPSMTQLCENYHVGIRTVRDVLEALKAEGYIKTAERRPSIVSYRRPEAEDSSFTARLLLEKKDAILQVYETMTLLMPRLFSFSLQNCSREKLDLCFYELKKLRKKDTLACWKAASSSLYNLLDASGNLLFCTLFTSFKVYARVPAFLESGPSPSFSEAYRRYSDPAWIIDAVDTDLPSEVEGRFTEMYHIITASVRGYLNEISAEYRIEPKQRKHYSWHPEQGRDHYYMQIVRSLIDQIGFGIYKDGEFLPSEAALAAEYDVSVATIRKAAATLNELGFCRTFNVKGTQVSLYNDEAAIRCLKSRVHKTDIFTYLSGLQLMAIAIIPAAELSFPGIGREEVKDLGKQFERIDRVPLDSLFECIVSHLSLEPLKTILCEVKDLLHWGYYFSFFPEGFQMTNEINKKSLQAFYCLQAGDRDGFARQMSLCYCHILTVVRDFIVAYGLTEADVFVTPELPPR